MKSSLELKNIKLSQKNIFMISHILVIDLTHKKKNKTINNCKLN
jgi:hypothetical protein